MKNPTIYVVTHYAFNHQGEGKTELDSRFLNSNKNYVYFLIDHECPSILHGKHVIYEKTFGPLLQEAGKKHFAEWSFLLAEAEQPFCEYPLFLISSRFYEKNRWLIKNLDEEWDRLFAYLEQYGVGVLPSYDRKFSWLDIWCSASRPEYKNAGFAFHDRLFALYNELYGVKIPEEYRYSPDFGCNYLGFRDRSELMSYVNFHKKIISYFFNEQYMPKTNIYDYVLTKNTYRNEKTFTFVIETYSKLYFFCNQKKYFGMHYDGYYEINEKEQVHAIVARFNITFYNKLSRFIVTFKRSLRRCVNFMYAR